MALRCTLGNISTPQVPSPHTRSPDPRVKMIQISELLNERLIEAGHPDMARVPPREVRGRNYKMVTNWAT